MAKVIITVEDTENGLFEIGIEGLTSEENHLRPSWWVMR